MMVESCLPVHCKIFIQMMEKKHLLSKTLMNSQVILTRRRYCMMKNPMPMMKMRRRLKTMKTKRRLKNMKMMMMRDQ